MKLIIAHLANDAFDAVRCELRDLGVHTTTISEIHTSSPQTAMALQYRGAAMQTHLRPFLKLECVAGDEQATAVVKLLRGHTGRAGAGALRVAVVDLEELYEASAADEVFLDDPRLDTRVH